MREPLTKRRALEICIELWDWLAQTANPHKCDWPGWQKYGQMHNGCPCCQYATEVTPVPGKICVACPLLTLWPTNGLGFCCCAYSSPYNRWQRNRGESKYARGVRRKCARIIANAAREALVEEVSGHVARG